MHTQTYEPNDSQTNFTEQECTQKGFVFWFNFESFQEYNYFNYFK